MVKMNAQLHSLLTYAGIDPAAFVLAMAARDPFGEEIHRNSAREIAAACPGIGVTHLNVGLWNDVVDLFSLTASDEGGTIEIMRIGQSQTITLSPAGKDAPFAVIKGGARDLRQPRALDTLRQPVAGKPAWLADVTGQVEVQRYLGRDRVNLRRIEDYVEVDVTVPDPYAHESHPRDMPLAA